MFSVEPSRCEMSYMAQSYLEIPLPATVAHSDKYQVSGMKQWRKETGDDDIWGSLKDSPVQLSN